MEFAEKIGLYIQSHGLLALDKGPVLVTLSGGADSVALLCVLLEMGYTCHAAHCNFHLRGEESDRDERFCCRLCSDLGVSFHVRHFDVAGYQSSHGVSVEMACRELRYAWFGELCEQLNCQGIAVGHHSDDNVETFFLNALRGSGIDGLAGMRPRNGNIVRPMLCVSRGEVEQYLASKHQEYIVDSTNLVNEYKRNKVRNVLLPCIEGEFPGSRSTLAATIEHVRDYADLFAELVVDLSRRIVSIEGDVARISIPELAGIKTAHLPLLLKALLKEYGVSYDMCESIGAIVRSGGQAGQHFHTSTHVLSLNSRDIVIERKRTQECVEYEVDFTDIISREIKLEFVFSNGVPFKSSLCDGKSVIALSEEVLNSRRVVLRHWREGDRMRPYGLKGSKLVSDIFTDAKLPPESRKQVWLLDADGVILWLIGYRAAEAFKVSPGSTKYVLIRYTR